MLTVGTDTYVTLDEANTYVDDNYVNSDEEKVAWTALCTTDKEIYLKRATKKIDIQRLAGIKAVDTQTLEFPRALHSDYLDKYFIYSNRCKYLTNKTCYDVDETVIQNDTWIIESDVSQNVKDAQVEEALALITQGAQANKRLQLQRQGVKSFSLGDLSESYGSGIRTVNTLTSTLAQELLKDYLNGGVEIC